MKCALPTGGKLTITESVLGAICAFAQSDLEACGMLIGHHPQDTDDIILDRLTLPQPEDRRTRNRCHRDQGAHQRLLDAEWKASGATRTYVGEWHTHPERVPVPSQLDRMSWKRATRETAVHGPGLVFVIVGLRVTRVWFGRRNTRTHTKVAEFKTHHSNQEGHVS